MITSGLSLPIVLALVVACTGEARAQSREIAGMITEIKLGGGRVEVKQPGARDWRPAGPLMGLLAGDTVRAEGGATAIVLLSGGRGVLRIETGTDPVVIPGPQPAESAARKVPTILSRTFNFLSTRARDFSQVLVGTRGDPLAPVVLVPRNSSVLADAPTFEWRGGSSSEKHSLQVAGPNGIVLELKDVSGTHVEYPSGAPALVPGTHYTLRLTASASQRVDRVWFEILGPEQTRQIREGLADLNREPAGSFPPNTLVILRAGFLADRGLLHDAQRELVGALARSPNEATLHLLLGNVYSQMGLAREAHQAFDEARSLIPDGPHN